MTEKSKIIPFPLESQVSKDVPTQSFPEPKKELIRLTFEQVLRYLNGDRPQLPDFRDCALPELLAIKKECDGILLSGTSVDQTRLNTAFMHLHTLIDHQVDPLKEKSNTSLASRVILFHS